MIKNIGENKTLIMSIKKRSKKRALTNREKLWKQVNKKVKKITYTLNPNSHFYEDETPVVRKVVEPDRGYDNDSFQWAKVASNIDWSGLLTTVEHDFDEPENEVIEPPPLLFEFDDFEIEDVVYEKMWN
jgi:hypothetical protein